MKRQSIVSVILEQKQLPQTALVEALNRSGAVIEIKKVSSGAMLLNVLQQQATLVFCVASASGEKEKHLENALYQYSPDTVLVRVSPDEWRRPAQTKQGIDVVTITSANADELRQQIDFLLYFAKLKRKFRHSKHLLRIAELRSQWLVDYAREAIAYVSHNKHLYVNHAYLTLFALQSNAEAQTMVLSHLVAPEQGKEFLALCAQAERIAQPSNKVLFNLQSISGHKFRAEVRFISAVFNQQRCVQLHIHPVHVVASTPIINQAGQSSMQNPWQALPPTEASVNSSGQAVFRFKLHEALNLKVQQRSKLYIVDNSITLGHGEIINQHDFIRQFDATEQRIKLDLWNVQKSIIQLTEWQRYDKNEFPIVLLLAIGDWVLNNSKAQKKLLDILATQHAVNQHLVLALQYSDLTQHLQQLKVFIPVLKQSGIQLALDQVGSSASSWLEMSKALRVSIVRMSSDFGSYISRQKALPSSLIQMINVAESNQLNIIIDGVNDIASMNILSATRASYLQGSILERFE